jgi:3-keto-5-aminohexanoate cleavage enzyme
MASKFENIPLRTPKPDMGITDPNAGMHLDFQPKWDIPDTIAITCAVVGGPIKRDRNPNQPYTTAEIRNAAIECIEAGARALHIHARDDKGEGLMDMQTQIRNMHEIVDPIRAKYGYSVVIDGSECTRTDFKEEMTLIDSELSEIAPINFNSHTPPKMYEAEAEYLRMRGVKPALALSCDGDLSRAHEFLIKKGLLEKPYYFGLLPGFGIGSSPLPDMFATANYLMEMIRQIKLIYPESIISVPMAGRASSYLAAQAILFGYDIRIGMEDTYFKWPHKDDVIENNAKTFVSMKTIAENLGRRVATADEYRTKLGLPKKQARIDI